MVKDDTIDLLVAGGLGFLLAQGQYNEWKPIIENYKKRLEHLKYLHIPPPLGYLDKNQNVKTIYRESIFCYLFGLPNSCMPSLVRVLEQALISKFQIIEGKPPSNDIGLAKLIDWGEKLLGEKSEIAHSFRMLRNYIHTDKIVKEQDAIEGIRHISSAVDTLFPIDYDTFHTICSFCKTGNLTKIPIESLILGNLVNIRCNKCGQTYAWILLP